VDEGKIGVAQVSKPAVSPISKSAGCRNGVASAGLETRDTSDLEVCATRLPMEYPVYVFEEQRVVFGYFQWENSSLQFRRDGWPERRRRSGY
jgi:hypothetical protein